MKLATARQCLHRHNMGEKNLIFVTTLTPSEVGHGGQHRSYQILVELEQIVGHGQVLLFTKQQMLQAMEQDETSDKGSVPKHGKLSQWASHRAGTAKRI